MIAHLCNDAAAWTFSCPWEEPERAFHSWAREGVWQGEPFGLGGAQFVEVAAQLWMANLVAEKQAVPPLRYGALETCLDKLQGFARPRAASVHLPRLDCDNWERVEALLRKMLSGLEVFVYDS